jgi:hypothetical protein
MKVFLHLNMQAIYTRELLGMPQFVNARLPRAFSPITRNALHF